MIHRTTSPSLSIQHHSKPSSIRPSSCRPLNRNPRPDSSRRGKSNSGRFFLCNTVHLNRPLTLPLHTEYMSTKQISEKVIQNLLKSIRSTKKTIQVGLQPEGKHLMDLPLKKCARDSLVNRKISTKVRMMKLYKKTRR